LFELEQPHLLTYKDVQLSRAGVATTCERHAVGVDLSSHWEHSLTTAGFDPARPSVWLLEGFLYFLAESAVKKLLAAITALSAPGTRIGLDVVNTAMSLSPATRHWNEHMTAAGMPWLFSTDQPEALLEPSAWRSRSIEPGAAGADYGRRPYRISADSVRTVPRSFLVTADRLAPA
jgi:methyltransferase (TIGR00027 family)